MKKLSCIVLILIFILVAIFPATAEDNVAGAREIIARTNLERQKVGASILKTNDTLNAAAQKRAKEIEKSFSHTRPNGESCFTVFDEYNIKSRSSAENIAYSGGYGSAEVAIDLWMNSTGHRTNMLNKEYTYIGVGYYQIGGKHYYVQLFATLNASSSDYVVEPYSPSTTAKSTTTTTTTTTRTTVTFANATGDVNGDGKVSVADARKLVVYLANGTVPDNFNEIADLNGDNRISVTDVRYLVLKISYGQV